MHRETAGMRPCCGLTEFIAKKGLYAKVASTWQIDTEVYRSILCIYAYSPYLSLSMFTWNIA